MRAIDDNACLTPGCENLGKQGVNIVGHGWLTTKSGRRRRYRCKICGGTVSLNSGTAYSGLRCTRREFDQVATLRVEGVSISATAQVTGHSRTTIARWLERAARAAARFNQRMVRDFDVLELQADELCTFIGSKSRPTWLFATIEVCSRLWASSLVGRRSYRNTTTVLNDVILRGRRVGFPLIATDGFDYYFGAIVRLVGSACVYGQVLKTRRTDRVVWVERRVKIGTASRLKDALLGSEDSDTVNTSFVERVRPSFRWRVIGVTLLQRAPSLAQLFFVQKEPPTANIPAASRLTPAFRRRQYVLIEVDESPHAGLGQPDRPPRGPRDRGVFRLLFEVGKRIVLATG